jgi:hypothetical protein
MPDSDEFADQARQERGPRFEEAWAALGRYPAHVECELAPSGAVRMVVKANQQSLLQVSLTLLIVGVLGMAAAAFLAHKHPEFTLSPKLMMFSILCAVMAPALGLIRLVTGPPKPARLEARWGQLNVDYYVAGDHIERAYTADEIQPAIAREGEVIIVTKMGFITIGHALPDQARRALAEVVNLVVWGELVSAESKI